MNCPICLEKVYAGDRSAVLCNLMHIMHEVCFNGLVARESVVLCPSCREPYPTPVRRHEEFIRFQLNYEKYIDNASLHGELGQTHPISEAFLVQPNEERSRMFQTIGPGNHPDRPPPKFTLQVNQLKLNMQLIKLFFFVCICYIVIHCDEQYFIIRHNSLTCNSHFTTLSIMHSHRDLLSR